MVQKTSPFIESKYGWNLGESGWNTGADENFVKFAFMLDNGVDDIVSTLPQTPVNGKAYYLTTDNRFYFVVDGTYYSSPCPKWFIFKLKSTGQKRIYDGVNVIPIPSEIDASGILSDLRSTFNSLSWVGTKSSPTVVEQTNNFKLNLPYPTNSISYDVSSIRSAINFFDKETGLVLNTYESLRNYSGDSTGCNIISSGTKGRFIIDSLDTSSADNSGTIIVDLLNRRWKRVYNGPADVRWFGAVQGADSTQGLKAAFNSGLPLYISGRYFCKERIVSTNVFSVVGDGRSQSSIYWTSDASSVGLELRPQNFSSLYNIKGVDLLTEATVETPSLLYADWSTLQTNTLSADNLFSPKLLIEEVEFKTVGQLARLTKAVVLNYVWSFEFSRIFIYGAYVANSSRNSKANFPTTIGIDIQNSKAVSVAAQGTTGGRFNDVTVQMCGLGVQTYQVEGMWVNNCDFQACFDGFYVTRNNLDRTNQLRFSNSHFGNPGTGLRIYQHNYTHVSGCEFSWGGLNADVSGEIPLLWLENSSFATVVNNTFRGNSAGVNDDHNVTGIKVSGSANNATNGFAINGSIVGNNFEHLQTGCNITGYSSQTFVDPSNRYSDVNVKIARDAITGWPAMIYGNTALDGAAPSTGYPQAYFANTGGIALGVNRIGGGNVMGFYADGTLGGFINVTTTSAALTNTSDETLKDDNGRLDSQFALEKLKEVDVRNFKWKSTQEEDVGVFAQQLYKVLPDAVYRGGWVSNKDGTIHEEEVEDSYYQPWTVNYTKLIPYIVAAIQGFK